MVVAKEDPSESTVPTYSHEPRQTEQQIDLGNGNGKPPAYTRPLPTATFTKTDSSISVLFHNQEENATIPTFVQDSLISGEISQDLFKGDDVAQVSIKLEGRMDAENAETSARKVKLIDDNHVVFKRGSAAYPTKIPFLFKFPGKYSDEGSDHVMPPSYLLNVPRVSGTNGKIEYFITVTVVKRAFLKKSKSIRLPIVYAPRSRPRYPVPDVPAHIPGANDSSWKRLTTNLKTTTKVGSVTCTLVLPSVNVYGVEDAIPFFLQLSGPLEVIQELLPSGEDPQETSSPAITTNTVPTSPRQAPVKARIVVSLVRRYNVTVLNDTAKRERVLGYGTLESLPPAPETPNTFVWKGQVRPDERLSVGGFKSGPIEVLDLFVLALNPPNKDSTLKPHQAQETIKLVSDPYDDSSAGPRRGLEELRAEPLKWKKETVAAALTYIGV